MALRLTEAADAIAGHTYRYGDELQLHTALEQALTDAGITCTREVRLAPRDRIDFLLPEGVGIEVKVGGSTSSLVRQLIRYARSEQVTELLVVTTRRQHRDVPREMNGKPVRVLIIGGVG